jgi:hypothetical protein
MWWIYRWLIALALFVVIAPAALACSPAMVAVKVTCLNGETEAVSVERAEYFLTELPATCDVGDDRAALAQEAQRWKDGWKGYFHGGSLNIMPYDQQQEAMAQRASAKLLSCWYGETRQFGAWLLIEATTREYCYEKPFIPCCLCPRLQVSFVMFAIFLISHPYGDALPYLGVLLGIIAGLAIFLYRLAKRGDLRQLIRPRISNNILAVILAIISVWWLVVVPIDLIISPLFAYLLASIVLYMKRKYARSRVVT